MFTSRDQDLHVHRHAHLEEERLVDKNNYKFKFMVFLLKTFATFLRLELAENSERANTMFGNNVQNSIIISQVIPRSKKSYRDLLWKRVRWPDVFLIFYIFGNLHISIFLYFQYSYDYNLIQMSRLTNLVSYNVSLDRAFNNLSSVANNGDVYARYKDLKLALEEDCYHISLIGGSCKQMNFLFEHVYCLFMLGALTGYLLDMIIFRLNLPYYCHSIQDLLDYDLEHEKANDIVENLVREFNRSRDIFYQCRGQKCELQFRKIQSEYQNSRLESRESTGLKKTNLTLDHSKPTAYCSRELMQQMKSLKALRPMNKTTEWIESRLNFQFRFYCCIICSYISLVFLFLLIATSYSEKEQLSSKSTGRIIMSQLINANLLIITLAALNSYTFFTSNAIIEAVDQAKLAKRIQKMIMCCIRINSRLFTLQLKGMSVFDLRKQMNINLMLALAQYKILVVQLNSGIMKPFKIFMTLLITLIVCPLLTKIHVPYMPDDQISRLYVVSVLFTAAQTCDMVTIPVCYLHSRYIDLYGSLSKLLAHTIEVNEINRKMTDKIGSPYLPMVYDEYMIIMLRKELENPHKTKKRFEARVFGVSCTYPIVCRAHFWFGILFISVVFGRHSSNTQLFDVILLRR